MFFIGSVALTSAEGGSFVGAGPPLGPGHQLVLQLFQLERAGGSGKEQPAWAEAEL